MKITVFGKYGPWPKAGGACSSYLVECKDATLLLDAGNGSFSNLQKYIDFRTIDAIILSHLHSDHISDLLVMRYAVQIKKSASIPLYLPESPQNMYEIFKDEKAYQTSVITDGMQISVGSTQISFKKMTHSVDSFAVRVRCEGKSFVYSGDTNLNDDLYEFAEGANVLLCDAAFTNENIPDNPPHLSSAQAAAIAKKAGVKKLLLTHISPEQNESELLSQAKIVFENTETTIENNTINI